MPIPRLTRIVLVLGLLGPSLLGACAHDFTVEGRETPVHVWLTSPGLAATGGSVDALIYVGSEKAIEGLVRFPPGVPNVVLPTLYMNAGSSKTVSVVLGGGEVSATDEVDIGSETWLQITIDDRKVTIRALGREPETR